MEYKFIHTTNGPAVMGEDEVVFFHQIPVLIDYASTHPDFIKEAKDFFSKQIKYLAETAAQSLYEPVVGGEQTYSLTHYIHAIEQLLILQHEMNQHK